MESAPFVAVLMMATACTSPDTPKPVASPPWASGIGTKSDTRQFLQTEADALVGFEHGVGVILAIVESDGRVIYKLDPSDGRPIARIQLTREDPEPHGLDISNGILWYCDAASGWICRLS